MQGLAIFAGDVLLAKLNMFATTARVGWANASLMAAAPLMLEALEMARDARTPGEMMCAIAMRDRAIAKAEGGTANG